MERMVGIPQLMRRVLLARAGLVLAALTGPLAAQQPTSAQQNAIRQSCRSDFQAHCSGVPTGGSAALNCLQQNAASVSAPCQQALSAIGGGGVGVHPALSGGPAPSAQPAPAPPLSPRQRAYILRQACGMDFQQNCHGVPLGGGHAIECLAAHRDTLSPGCQKALASARQ
jgi:Cysteine rich repeat